MNHTTLVLVAVLAAAALVIATLTAPAFASVNLNSSKSNVFRVHQEQSVNAETINGPVIQTSTISCECSQSDTTTINNSEG